MSIVSFDADTSKLTIKCPFGEDQLSIRRYETARVYFYELSATLKRHTVVNDAVSLWPIPDFLTSLDSFECTRSGESILDGTYDCRLTVRPHNLRGDAWIEFCVCEYLMLNHQPADRDFYGNYSLTGGISIHGDEVALMRDCFKQLFYIDSP